MDTSELKFHLFFEFIALGEHLGFEVLKVLVAAFFIDPCHEVRGEVDDLLELLCLQLFFGFGSHEQVRKPRTGTAEVPDVDDGSGEFDVGHTLTTNLRTRYLNAAAFADNALEAHSLVLTAVALPVLRRTENLLAEKTVFFGL